jgi:small-conductance mechanosensitive channel
MISSGVTYGQVGWVTALIFGFPIVMVLLGEATRRLQRRRNPVLPAVRILRNWVIPSLTLFVLLAQVIGMGRGTVQVRIAETLLWISLIYGALTLLNSVLFEGAPQGSWQAKVPQLFRDLGRFILVLLGSSIVLSTVWGADLGGFLTALGVGSLVLGLALQDSLGNIFSGVALLFEQPIRLGDWVEVGGKEGRVVEVNWRAVHLLNGNDDLIVVPNSELGKTSFTNMSRPAEGYLKSIHINFSLNDPPNAVTEMLENTAQEMQGVLKAPPPTAELVSFNESSISYVLKIACPDYGQSGVLADELMRRLWYVARREGLTIPYPTKISMPYREPAARQSEGRQKERLRGLRNSFFAVLPPGDLEELAGTCLEREYAGGEVILQQGTPLTSLFLLLEGEAEVLVASPGDLPLIVGVLCAGECFGEKVTLLHNRIADSTVRAVTDVRVLVIDGKTLSALNDEHPRLGRDLNGISDIRHRAILALQQGAAAAEPTSAPWVSPKNSPTPSHAQEPV